MEPAKIPYLCVSLSSPWWTIFLHRSHRGSQYWKCP